MSEKKDITKEHTFIKDNIKESIIDSNKDYFEFQSTQDEKYSFLNWRNYLHSKLFIKSFYWSIGIGSAVYIHRYVRTRLFNHSLKWGVVAMFGSFIFVWGSLEFQPFIVNLFQSKQLDKKRKEEMIRLTEEKYRKSRKPKIKEEESLKTKDKLIINSDYYARNFLDSQNILLNSMFNQKLEIKYIMRVIFKLNPFVNEDAINTVDIADDFETEEEEFYLNEIDEIGKDKIKIKSIWIDYDKLKELGYYDSSKHTTISSIKKDLSYLHDKEENELSSIEYDIKELITKNLVFSKNNEFFDVESIKDFTEENLLIAQSILNNTSEQQSTKRNNYI